LGLNITILAVGRIREKPITALCEEYAGRIRKYGHTLSIEEIKDEPGDRPSDKILAREANRLRSRIPQGAYPIAMDISGETCSSTAFAERIGDLMMQGTNKGSLPDRRPPGIGAEACCKLPLGVLAVRLDFHP